MKRIIILTIVVLGIFRIGFTQTSPDSEKYRRSSLYSILISHPSTKFNDEIVDVFFKIPIPDKYDNHDLSVKVITTTEKRESETQIAEFLSKNAIGRRMLAKWFNRDIETGDCNMALIMERGLYDATYFDVVLSKMSQRGMATLTDAGE